MIHNLIQATINHNIMSKTGERLITQDRILPESEWSEEVIQAKAFLEKEGFQVLLVGRIDMVGALNYHIQYVGELQRELKQLKESAQKRKKASGVKL